MSEQAPESGVIVETLPTTQLQACTCRHCGWRMSARQISALCAAGVDHVAAVHPELLQQAH